MHLEYCIFIRDYLLLHNTLVFLISSRGTGCRVNLTRLVDSISPVWAAILFIDAKKSASNCIGSKINKERALAQMAMTKVHTLSLFTPKSSDTIGASFLTMHATSLPGCLSTVPTVDFRAHVCCVVVEMLGEDSLRNKR